jgi:hypothetical protein
MITSNPVVAPQMSVHRRLGNDNGAVAENLSALLVNERRAFVGASAFRAVDSTLVRTAAVAAAAARQQLCLEALRET